MQQLVRCNVLLDGVVPIQDDNRAGGGGGKRFLPAPELRGGEWARGAPKPAEEAARYAPERREQHDEVAGPRTLFSAGNNASRPTFKDQVEGNSR
jgi:hypothetical protein